MGIKPNILTEDEAKASLPDAELVHTARRGDKRAFVKIVARLQSMVCGLHWVF